MSKNQTNKQKKEGKSHAILVPGAPACDEQNWAPLSLIQPTLMESKAL